MKLLLTSAGIKNASIHTALLDLLGKPIAESSALCIPTAGYGYPGGFARAWDFISGREPRCPMCELGWKSLGVLELTALPSLDQALWVSLVQETDVLLVNGGNPALSELLDEAVRVGRPAALAERGLGRLERWQHDHGSPRRQGIRRLDTTGAR